MSQRPRPGRVTRDRPTRQRPAPRRTQSGGGLSAIRRNVAVLRESRRTALAHVSSTTCCDPAVAAAMFRRRRPQPQMPPRLSCFRGREGGTVSSINSLTCSLEPSGSSRKHRHRRNCRPLVRRKSKALVVNSQTKPRLSFFGFKCCRPEHQSYSEERRDTSGFHMHEQAPPPRNALRSGVVEPRRNVRHSRNCQKMPVSRSTGLVISVISSTRESSGRLRRYAPFALK